MPRFRQITEIQQLMDKKEQIRNLGIVAHIDHGKTTLADTLLAGTGLLSPTMAGTARVLDYLEEEQKRKITMKAANISVLTKRDEKRYIINLVDTPGHVDFTGRVTRALRAIDGVVVIVDAVEEIMAQTEIVTRQALEERVKPVLFINKIDRLITELRLDATQIEKKLEKIINGFNDLIELYAEEPFKKRWKVSTASDSVSFASALHGWGFTLSRAKEKNIKFADILDAYKNKKQEKLKIIFPVYKAVFEMAIKNLPDPKNAQSYRIEKIWKGNIETEAGQEMIKCNDEGPLVICVTNVHAENDGSTLVTGRVFSGKIESGKKIWRVNSKSEIEVRQVSVCMGSFNEPVPTVSAGNLVCLKLPQIIETGETLTDLNFKDIEPFEEIKYISEPVITIVVEPKNPKDLTVLIEAMDKLASEDPNIRVEINKETGEYLLSGMGELHIEISMKQLRKRLGEIEILESPPRAVYRESVSSRGENAWATSPNRQNRFKMQISPINEKILLQLEQEEKTQETEGLLDFNEYKNALFDRTDQADAPADVLEAIISGFDFACRAGPLCGEPLRHIKAELIEIKLSKDPKLRNSVEIMHGVGKAIFGSLLSAKPILLEPVYKLIMTAPAEMAGECSRILNGRRGKVTLFEQKGAITVITGFIPVSETFGLSKELRSTTSGRAFWQSMFDHWEKITDRQKTQIINEVRKRKGLPSEVPQAKIFLEEDNQ